MTDYAVLYEILENDEIGLIPKEAGYAMIDYDKTNKLESVFFSPPIRYPRPDMTMEEYQKEITKIAMEDKRAVREMNKNQRTIEEVRKIANRLEASLVD
jgi:hypothetical protein